MRFSQQLIRERDGLQHEVEWQRGRMNAAQLAQQAQMAAQQNMIAQSQGLAQHNAYQNGLLGMQQHDWGEYICNCVPDRASALARGA